MTESEGRQPPSRVGDLMIPLDDYPHLPVWSTLRDAIEVMLEWRLDFRGNTSLPRILLLFDLDGSLAGTVRRRDILRGIEPEFLLSRPLDYRKKLFDVEVDPNLGEMTFDKVVKGMCEKASRPVEEVMRPFDISINYDDHIVKAVYEMVTHNLSLLPVVKDGKVAGVVRTVDVFSELAGSVLRACPPSLPTGE